MTRMGCLYIALTALPFMVISSINSFAQQICSSDTLGVANHNCVCQYTPRSLLANPSFEEYRGCPYDVINNNDPDLAVVPGWFQPWLGGGNQFVQYYNTSCDTPTILGYPHVPEPLPAGNGYIGFGVYDEGSGSQIPKIYFGTYPLTQLQAGTRYSLTFYLGFGSPCGESYCASVYPDITIGIFGNPDKKPSETINTPFGCPLNLKEGWALLGAVQVHGNNQWVQGRIDFTPATNIQTIAIGEDCNNTPGKWNYYYIDDLILAPTDSFHFKTIKVASGDPCRGYVLSVEGGSSAVYQWYKDSVAIPGATDDTYSVTPHSDAGGYYNVRMEENGKCTISSSKYIRISAATGLKLSKDTILCKLNKLVTHVHPSGFTVRWQDGSMDSAYVVSRPGLYWVVATDSSGCTVNDSLNVQYKDCGNCQVYLPNAFTPNGNGQNDVFRARSICTVVTDFKMRIFNRWGQLVYESNNIDMGWDGTIDDQQAPTGTYVYEIRYALVSGNILVPQTKKGSVILIR